MFAPPPFVRPAMRSRPSLIVCQWIHVMLTSDIWAPLIKMSNLSNHRPSISRRLLVGVLVTVANTIENSLDKRLDTSHQAIIERFCAWITQARVVHTFQSRQHIEKSRWRKWLNLLHGWKLLTVCLSRTGKNSGGHANIFDTFPKERLKLCLFQLIYMPSHGQEKMMVDRQMD